MALLVQDVFTEASDTVLSLHAPDIDVVGGGWGSIGADVVAADNAVRISADGRGGWIDSGSADLSVSFSFDCGGADNRFTVEARGQAVRGSFAIPRTAYAINVRAALNRIIIFSRVSAVETQLGGSITVPMSISGDYNIRVDVTGSSPATIEVYLDAGTSRATTLVATRTDSAVPVGGYAGFYHNKFVNNSLRIDNFEVRDFLGGDITAPILTNPTGAATGLTTASGTVDTDEGNGSAYLYTNQSATPPSEPDHITGTSADAFSIYAVIAAGTIPFPAISGLALGTAYYNHYLHQDASGNNSLQVTSAPFTTSDTVGNSANNRWNLFNIVSGAAQIEWNSLQSTSNISTQQWNLLSSVNNNKQAIWDSLRNASNDEAFHWNASEEINSVMGTIWDILSALFPISSSTDIRWSVRQESQNTFDFRWDLLESIANVSNALQTQWDLSQEVVNQNDLRWHLYEVVNNEVHSLWDLLSSIINGEEVAWHLFAETSNRLQTIWSIISSLNSVGNANSVLWSTIGRVSNIIDTRWQILNVINSQLDSRWGLLNELGVTSDMRWEILVSVSDQMSSRWNLFSGVGAEFDVRWDSAGRVDNNVSIRWNVSTLQGILPLEIIVIPAQGRIISIDH